MLSSTTSLVSLLLSSLAITQASHIDPLFQASVFARSTQNDTGLDSPDGNATVTVPETRGGLGIWGKGYKKAKALVDQMTLEEKVGIVTGQIGRCAGNTLAIPRLGLPSICIQDGPAGPRPVIGSSQFPAGMTAAATWNRDLIYQRGKAMGQEFHDLGINVALGPVTGGPLGRAPLEGRNYEGFFSDPYATGVAAYYGVKGLQDSGVAACAKHWIEYEQETFRNLWGSTASYSEVFNASEQLPVSSNVDDKTTHELYMPSFAEAIRAGVAYVMCSYNELNNTHSCAHSHSLSGLLKTELNFAGPVISDWGAVWATEGYLEAGMDVNMPNYGYDESLGAFWGTHLEDLVKNDKANQERLADAATRTLVPYFALGQDTKPLPSVPFNAVNVTPHLENGTVHYRNVQKPSTVELIKKIGIEGAVLLKNEGGLPLKKPSTIAIIGEDAGPNVLGFQACGAFGDSCPLGNNNGTTSLSGGSGYAFPHNLITPLNAIQNRAAQDGTYVQAVLNNSALDQVALAASTSEVALVFVTIFTEEGQDRENYELGPGSVDIIKTAAAANNNTIVIMHIPGAVNFEEFYHLKEVTAILAPLLPGEQTGNSLVSLLYGDVSPSGKLPFTIGKSLQDYPPNTIVQEQVFAPQADFTEKLNIDYRWFDAKNIEPRYEFGFGLTYSSFSYSNLKISKGYKPDNQAIQVTDEKFAESNGKNSLYDVVATVSFSVKNTGKVTASEVAQLYVTFAGEEDQPPKQLRGFDKLKLSPGQTGKATFELRLKDLSVWDVVHQQWRHAKGEIKLHGGASSRKLPLVATY